MVMVPVANPFTPVCWSPTPGGHVVAGHEVVLEVAQRARGARAAWEAAWRRAALRRRAARGRGSRTVLIMGCLRCRLQAARARTIAHPDPAVASLGHRHGESILPLRGTGVLQTLQTLRMSMSPRPPISACSRIARRSGVGRWRGSKAMPSSRKVSRTESSCSRTSREMVSPRRAASRAGRRWPPPPRRRAPPRGEARRFQGEASRPRRSSSNPAANPSRVAGEATARCAGCPRARAGHRVAQAFAAATAVCEPWSTALGAEIRGCHRAAARRDPVRHDAGPSRLASSLARPLLRDSEAGRRRCGTGRGCC